MGIGNQCKVTVMLALEAMPLLPNWRVLQLNQLDIKAKINLDPIKQASALRWLIDSSGLYQLGCKSP